MIYDAHAHIFPKEIRNNREGYYNDEGFKLLYQSKNSPMVGADELVRSLDDCGIAAACSFGFPWASSAPTELCNDYVLSSAKKYPGRIIPFACVNPLLGSASLREASKRLAEGAVGIGEIAAYQYGIDSNFCRLLEPLATLCAEADAPLVLHVDEPLGCLHPGKGRTDLFELYELIKKHPETKWILAHFGGGMFFYGLLKKEVGKVFKNVWYDTSAGPYLYKPGVYRAALDVVGAGRLLFGSDFPLLSIDRYIEDMDACGLDESEKKAVLGGNLAALLGIQA